MGIHGPGYLAVTGPSARDGEATTLRCRTLWLCSAARGKSKCWLHSAARCGPGLTDSVVRDDWHSNGNGENLQFLLSYVKQPSMTDNHGFHFIVGNPWHVDATVPFVLFIRFFQNDCKTLRDTEILFTLISAAALMETLITVFLCVELVLQPHAGQTWLMFSNREKQPFSFPVWFCCNFFFFYSIFFRCCS